MDGKGKPDLRKKYPVNNMPPDPLTRNKIEEILPLGIKAIDSLITCGKGQRVGVFAGSGVGKSTLMGMIAKNTKADINVIALIGERGREVREFIENELGEEGLSRSVVIVATSDQPALVRVKGALLATSIAEFFRDQAKDVVLMMDSLTRFSMAQRENWIGCRRTTGNTWLYAVGICHVAKVIGTCGGTPVWVLLQDFIQCLLMAMI